MPTDVTSASELDDRHPLDRPVLLEATSTASSLNKAIPDYSPASLDDSNGYRQDGGQLLYSIWLEKTIKLRQMPIYLKSKRFVQGPNPPETLHLRQFNLEQSLERFLAKSTRSLKRWRWILLPLFLALWLIAIALLVKESWFSSSTNAGSASPISSQASFWAQNDQCGLNGQLCEPFTNTTSAFRCPANPVIRLLNTRAIGSTQINYQPLLVGGGDDLHTYRADSWICAAARQQGLISNYFGGCAVVEQVGAFTNFIGTDKNGVDSVTFNTSFPSAFRLNAKSDSAHCKDLKFPILAFNVVMLFLFSIALRPPSVLIYWTCVCVGFWHLVVTKGPPNLSQGFGTFLPTLFICYVFWRVTYRHVLPPFKSLILERSILFLGLFWIGVMMDLTLDKIPVSRLTPHDIKQQPGGLIAVIILSIFLLFVIVNQLRVIRKTGWLLHYLGYYAIGLVIVGILAALPGLEFRIHHYIAAMVLIPGTAFPTRLSLAYSGFLLGMFLNGAAVWGFDSILQTAAELQGDAPLGSDLPTWVTNSVNFLPTGNISWNPIPSNISESWNGFALIVDDVLAYTGNATSYAINQLDASLPHYFRLAYQSSGTSGDFTQAAVWNLGSTWIDAAPGPS